MPSTNPRHQFWILTVPHSDWSPPSNLTNINACYIAGQRELSDGGFDHWQIVAYYANKVRMGTVKADFARTAHCEPTRSQAARDYVWKDDTAVEGTRFELGELPFRRNSKTDWEAVYNAAKCGSYDPIPARVIIQHYRNIKQITADNLVPAEIETSAIVYWGPTGVGKSRRAWFEAGMDAYPKDPRTKWWDGYRNQQHCVIDEFRGDIDIAHMLRWLDRYPCLIEQKGTTTVKSFKKIWITSNIPPEEWYPTLDFQTKDALLRRLTVINMTENWSPNEDNFTLADYVNFDESTWISNVGDSVSTS